MDLYDFVRSGGYALFFGVVVLSTYMILPNCLFPGLVFVFGKCLCGNYKSSSYRVLVFSLLLS